MKIAKKKNTYQIEKKQSLADQKKIREAQRAEYMPIETDNYECKFKALNKLVPIDRDRYR
jgi:hypothetical protein